MRWWIWIPAVVWLGCSQEHNQPVDSEKANSTTTAPRLTIDAPQRGAWLPAGAIEVSGTAENVSGLTLNEAALDTANIDTANGRYATTAELNRGINLLTVQAATAQSSTAQPSTTEEALMERVGVMAGDYAEPDEPVIDGVLARINQGGIAEMVTFIEGLITPALIGEDISTLNPLAEGDILGVFSYRADLVSMDFGAPEIIVLPADGELRLQAGLPDLSIDLNVNIDIAVTDFDVGVGMTSSRAVLDTRMIPGATNGTLTMALEGTTLTLANFLADISAIPDWLEGIDLLQQELRSAVEDELINQLNTLVPEILDETLQALDFSFETELFGRDLAVAASFASVDVDPQGLEIGVDVAVDVPGEGNKTYAGVLAAGVPAPSPASDAEMAIMLADDFLNRVLFEVWRGGIADLQLSTADGSLDVSLLDGLPIETATVTVDAGLPPVVVSSNGQMQLQLAEWVVTLDTPGASIGNQLIARVAAEAELGVVVSDNALGIALGEFDLTLDVIESDWSLSEGDLLNLLDALLTEEALAGLLEDFRFALPELYGVRLANALVERADSELHTAVEIDLEILSE